MIEIKTDTKRHLVFSRNGADGILAAFAVKYAFDDNLFNEEWPMNVKCEFCDYGEGFSLSHFKGKVDEFLREEPDGAAGPDSLVVYMLDYTIQPNGDMMKFCNYVTKVIGAEMVWIDHRPSAIEDLSHFGVPGVQSAGECACASTWKFLSETAPKSMDRGPVPPMAFRMVSAFEAWDTSVKEFSWADQVVPFAMVLQSFPLAMNDNRSDLVRFLLKAVSDDGVALSDPLMAIGKALFCRMQNDEQRSASRVYRGTFMGKYSCLALNSQACGGEAFGKCGADPGSVDLLVVWSFNGSAPERPYEYHVYTERDGIDVGKLCEEALGGGGHQRAGGGSSAELLVAAGNA